MKKIVSELAQDPKYPRFITPLDESTDFRDATYFLRSDGTFVFSEGYYHQLEKPRSERKLISHIVFAPRDPRNPGPDYSEKILFGREYENITKEIMNNQPLENFYPFQLKKYIELDPSQEEVARPVYARYKSMVPVTELIGTFPTLHSLQAIIEKAPEEPAAMNIKIIAEQTAELLGIDPSQLGISGSLSIGTYTSPHDVDFVVHGTAAEVKRMVEFMYTLTDRDEKRKVYEFGKYWPIRFWDWAGEVKFMVCPFFSYLDPDEAPLRNFDCEDLGSAIVEARISDHTHNAFNPSVLELEEVKLGDKDYPDISHLILYHGGERGDWREGYRIRVNGNHVRIKTYRLAEGKRQPKEEFEAVLVNNLGRVLRIDG